MSRRRNHKEKNWGRRALQGVLAVIILAICFDYGKHLVLKRVLESEIANSQGLVSLESATVSPWPLFQNQLILKNFHVNVSGTSIAAQIIRLRQGWLDWRQAHIYATEIKSDEMVKVQEAQGFLDTRDIKIRVKVSQLILKNIQAQLPFLAFSGTQAFFDFLYDIASRHLSLKVDAPEMAFPNGVTFGLSGEGTIETKTPVHGKMDVKIKNIDKMMKELVAAGVVDASQAGLVTAGSDFLGRIGLHDITLPLKIEDGNVSLGPISLFKVGKNVPTSGFARNLGRDGRVVKNILEVFRQYKTLIEQCAEDIVQKKGLPKETIANILDPETPVSNISLQQLNDIAQVVFLRPPGTERKDAKNYNEKFLPYTTQAVLNLFDGMGDLRPVYPKGKTYSYIFLNGSTVANMRQKLKTLVDFVETQKIHIWPETEIIFLTGERDLFPEENEAQFIDPSPLKQDPSWKKPVTFPVTEDQAAEWIWNQSKLPDSLRKATITFVRAKKKPDGKRPTTFDTIQAWINDYQPKPGTCLSISSQPFVYYQEATIYGVFKKAGLLEKGFSVEGVGLGVENKDLDYFRENIAIVLDNFARTIYTEAQNAGIQNIKGG